MSEEAQRAWVRGSERREPGVRRRHWRRGPPAAQRMLQKNIVRAVQLSRDLATRARALSDLGCWHPNGEAAHVIRAVQRARCLI